MFLKTSTLNWLSGILGAWLIVVVFMGFSSTLNRIFFVATGFIIAALNFLAVSRNKRERDLSGRDSNSDSEIMPPNAGRQPE